MRTEGFMGALLSALLIASLVTPLLLLSPSPVHAALTPHDPISIDGNAGFTPENGVNGGGSGTENDPYIIENWDISAENANGIEIRNTTAYFVIRNCYVHDGRNNIKYGVCFANVANGVVDHSVAANNYYGACLSYSDNNTLNNNTFKNSGSGICLSSSSNNILDNNTFENNDSGIYLSSSDNNILDNNTLENNDSGIQLISSCNYNILTNNTCENNDYHGIYLLQSSNNTLINNTCENNDYGIYLYYSSNNFIYHNNFVNNVTQAYDDSSNYWDNGYPSGGNYWSDYTGEDNYWSENQDIPGSDGIGDTPYYIPGDNNRDRYPLMNPVVGGLISRPPICIESNENFTPANGVTSGSGTENDPYTIENWNITAENDNGIEIRNTTAYFVVRNCVVENGGSSYYGIYLYNVVNGRIENNTCANDYSGIYLRYSSNNTLINNTCENNDYDGINLLYSDNNTVVNNTCDNNNYNGICLGDSVNNILKNNSCQNNNNGVCLCDVLMLDGANPRSGSDNNILINNSCESNNDGINLRFFSDNNTLINNTCEYNGDGIYLGSSYNNSITNNTCENNYRGIYLGSVLTLDNHRVGANNNTITNNIMKCNHKGIYLEYSDNNRIYHNNLIDDMTHAHDNGTNYWDNGYPSGGNYWSDYTGVDNYRGENQDILGSDGIGDTSYDIPSDNNQDRYPLMNPYPVSGTAVFSLQNLYKVSLEIDLWLYEGSKLVVKFYTYGDAFENENVIEVFAPPAHVEENENARHPEGIGMKKVRLDLTTDNTENVIATVDTFVVNRGVLIGRISAIKARWPYAQPPEKSALISEISGIKSQWPYAPT